MTNKISFSTYDLLSGDLYGGVKYDLTVNSNTDLQVGGAYASQVVFTTKDARPSVGDEFTYYIDNVAVNKYVIKSIEKNKTNRTITAYDYISKFDEYCDDFLSAITFPITLGNLFTGLCTFYGVTGNSTFNNSSFSVKGKFSTHYMSGRQMLAYIAQLAGGFAVSNNGTITIRTFTTNSTAFTNSTYKAVEFADYVCPAITKVCIQSEEGDLGVSSGTGDEVLNIVSNPLTFGSDALQTLADSLLTVVGNKAYKPIVMSAFCSTAINAGDIITVSGNTCFIFSKHLDSSGSSFESTGNATRNPKETLETDYELKALAYNYNSLNRSLTETNSTVKAISDANELITTQLTEVSQTANSVTIKVNEQIEPRVNSVEGVTDDVTAYFDFTTDGLFIYGGNKNDPSVSKYKLKLSYNQIKFIYDNMDRLKIDAEGETVPGSLTVGESGAAGKINTTDGSDTFCWTINNGHFCLVRG